MKKKIDIIKKPHIRKGDTVMVITGNDKGQKGTVLEVIRKKNRAIVEGLNMVTKHIKPSAQNPEGGVVQTEAGIHISNLMLVDPATGEPTKIGRRRNEEGKLKRYSKKTDQFID